MNYKPIEEIEIMWEDPPPEKEIFASLSDYRGAVLARFRAELIAHPQQWAIMPWEGVDTTKDGSADHAEVPLHVWHRKAKNHADTITRSAGSWLGSGPWEAKAVGGKVYVRFVPQENTFYRMPTFP